MREELFLGAPTRALFLVKAKRATEHAMTVVLGANSASVTSGPIAVTVALADRRRVAALCRRLCHRRRPPLKNAGISRDTPRNSSILARSVMTCKTCGENQTRA